ncbi:MAG: ribosome maturation factor RimM [Lactobacillus sp.]|jgi:16S rRNA processing protein RimM|nr:ribosome maturation factor RimM [Lactobacillus sp.]MCH3906139.1 ribosome maturation factor RimM [Lactobacillus sp.]MCH3990284.1 ribosome maturation factor RimM [Lactobacillus sp.]MCH4069002.1 ribosome maturation factor RimM [Lactobacillus sp.]MCI1303404.1 ribosome maturation factor RimM [Lactobacillus sp.]
MDFYEVGQIINTHGINGEVKVKVITDFPADRFQPGQQLHFQNQPDQVLTVTAGRPFKQFWLVKFAEITDLDAAKKLQGQMLTIAASDQPDLPAGVYYYHDILGCQAVDADSGEIIGEVTDIEAPGANDIWQITKPNGKNFWLPYIPACVKKVDLEHKQVQIKVMEGLD